MTHVFGAGYGTFLRLVDDGMERNEANDAVNKFSDFFRAKFADGDPHVDPIRNTGFAKTLQLTPMKALAHIPDMVQRNFGDGIRRHPTNLYEILFWLMLWLVLKILERRYRFTDGSKFKIFLSSYLIFRFLVEFIKPDYFFSFGLSLIQLVCIAGILYYYKVFLHPSKLVKSHA